MPVAAFVPVSIAVPPVTPVTPAGISPPSQAGDEARIEIALVNGRRVMVSALLDPAILARLLSVLDAP